MKKFYDMVQSLLGTKITKKVVLAGLGRMAIRDIKTYVKKIKKETEHEITKRGN